MSRDKGARFERSLAKDFSKWTGILWDRTFRSGGGDVKGDIAPVDSGTHFCVEIKNRESWRHSDLFNVQGEIFNWWDKLIEDAQHNQQLPLLVFKRNRHKALALLDRAGYAVLHTGRAANPLPTVLGRGHKVKMWVNLEHKGHELILISLEDLLKMEGKKVLR